MGITDISLDSNKKLSSGELANYNSNSTGSNVNTESSCYNNTEEALLCT